MSQHRAPQRRLPRNRLLLGLVIVAGAAFAMLALGLVVFIVTGTILVTQFVLDLIHGY